VEPGGAFLDFFAAGVAGRHVCGASLCRGCVLGDIKLPCIAGGNFPFFVGDSTDHMLSKEVV